MPEVNTLAEAREWIDREVGVSDWLTVTQDDVDRFADTTRDHQFIHLDQERAERETPFGGTIAHGFLTLSLLSHLGASAGTVRLASTKIMINYGLDRVRFLNPVRVGKRVRGRFELISAEEKKPGQYLLKHRAVVEIEDEDKPAMIAEWLGLSITG
ncbi:MAG: MaoC family dehydratase [Pseudomonadota bacterium]